MSGKLSLPPEHEDFNSSVKVLIPVRETKWVCIIALMDIVLYEPDIPGNTGNIGRTCLATGSRLHLVGKLGFSLDDTYVKRSGLDYWAKVKLVKHKNWEAFLLVSEKGVGDGFS